MLETLYRWFTHSRFLLYILIFVFVGVTYFTTLNGIIGYVFGSWEAASLVQLISFSIVILCVQAYLLLRSTRQVIEFRQNGFLKNIVWFALWIFTFFFSAIFSYTFYYDLLSADAHSDQVIKQGINKVVGNADRYLSDFESAKSEMDKLAVYSAETALVEEKQGGTCGDQSPPGKGPRIRYRQKEEQVFQEQAQKIASLRTLVNQEISRFKQHARDFESKKITSTSELEEAFNTSIVRLNSYGSDNSTIKGVLARLQEHYRQNRNTGGVGSDGLAIFCPDREIDNTIDDIKSRFDAIPTIESVTLFDRTDRRQLQNRVIEVFYSPFASEGEQQNQQFSRNDYMALGLGFLLEILMFLVTLVLHQGAQSYSTNKEGYIGEWFSSREALAMSERLALDVERLQAVDRKGIAMNSGFLLVVDAMNDNDSVLLALDRQGLFSQKAKAVPITKLPNDLQQLLQLNEVNLVNTYFSPWFIWQDVQLSLAHLRA